MIKNFKFLPKVSAALSHLILLLAVVILFFGRTKPFLRIDVLLKVFPDFYQHVSNFSISFLILAGVGFMWVMLALSFKYITLLTLLILLSNFIYELWIPVLNTPDIIDAYYGMAGSLLAFIWLLLIKSFGLKANPNFAAI